MANDPLTCDGLRMALAALPRLYTPRGTRWEFRACSLAPDDNTVIVYDPNVCMEGWLMKPDDAPLQILSRYELSYDQQVAALELYFKKIAESRASLTHTEKTG